MLPPSHRDRYQEFLEALLQLQKVADLPTQEGASVNAALQKVQEIFTTKILNLSLDQLDLPAESRMQSYLTEIHRLMRMLQMDMMFLQASQHRETQQQRRTAFDHRVKNLISWCESILQTE